MTKNWDAQNGSGMEQAKKYWLMSVSVMMIYVMKICKNLALKNQPPSMVRVMFYIYYSMISDNFILIYCMVI